MSRQKTIQAYSDEALKQAIIQLKNADYLGSWGKNRLEELESEAHRRKLTRRV